MLFKSKNRKKDLGFFFAVSGLNFMIETVIYIFLRAYEYYPRIITFSPKNDGVVGNIISQFSISTAAMLICIFEIPITGVVLASVIFFLIENLFLALGIYEVYWYRPWITFIGFTAIFQMVKKWHRSVINGDNKLVYYITAILGILTLYLPTTNWISILIGYFVIKKDILIDPYISHAVVVIPKYLFQIHIFYFLNRYKARWIWNAAAAAVILSVDGILYYTNIMYVKEGWMFIYSGISIFTTYLYVYIVNKLLDAG